MCKPMIPLFLNHTGTVDKPSTAEKTDLIYEYVEMTGTQIDAGGSRSFYGFRQSYYKG